MSFNGFKRAATRTRVTGQGQGPNGDPTIIGDTDQAKTATTEFINNVKIVTKYPEPLSYLRKLARYEGDKTRNVWKWNVGLMEIWILNSTDVDSDDIMVLPKLTYPTVKGDGGLSGVWGPVTRDKESPVKFISKDNVEDTIYTAEFSVWPTYMDKNPAQLIAEFRIQSEKLGNIYFIYASLGHIHDQP